MTTKLHQREISVVWRKTADVLVGQMAERIFFVEYRGIGKPMKEWQINRTTLAITFKVRSNTIALREKSGRLLDETYTGSFSTDHLPAGEKIIMLANDAEPTRAEVNKRSTSNANELVEELERKARPIAGELKASSNFSGLRSTPNDHDGTFEASVEQLSKRRATLSKAASKRFRSKFASESNKYVAHCRVTFAEAISGRGSYILPTDWQLKVEIPRQCCVKFVAEEACRAFSITEPSALLDKHFIALRDCSDTRESRWWVAPRLVYIAKVSDLIRCGVSLPDDDCIARCTDAVTSAASSIGSNDTFMHKILESGVVLDSNTPSTSKAVLSESAATLSNSCLSDRTDLKPSEALISMHANTSNSCWWQALRENRTWLNAESPKIGDLQKFLQRAVEAFTCPICDELTAENLTRCCSDVSPCFKCIEKFENIERQRFRPDETPSSGIVRCLRCNTSNNRQLQSCRATGRLQDLMREFCRIACTDGKQASVISQVIAQPSNQRQPPTPSVSAEVIPSDTDTTDLFDPTEFTEEDLSL